jgi:hypothetical protein
MESVPSGFASAGGALEAITSGMRFLAELDAAQLPASVTGDVLRGLEKLDAVEAVARGRLLWVFDADRGYTGDGYGGVKNWVRYGTKVSKGQADAHVGLMRDRARHPVFQEGLLEGHLSVSVARRLGKITWKIEDDADRAWVDGCLVTAAASGAGEHDLVTIANAAVERLAPPDPDKPFRDRSLTLESTFEGAGVLRGELTPECAAVLGAVLTRLALKRGGEDTRSQVERNHDALQEMARRLLGSDLIPRQTGHAVMANVHVWLGDLLDLDDGSVMARKWTERYAALWAAKRIAAAEGRGDGGAWITGPAAKGITCDAAMFPIVVGDPDLDAAEDLLRIAVELDGYLHHHDDQTNEETADSSTDSTDTMPDADSTDSTPDRIGAAAGDPERAGTVIALMEQLIGAAAAMMSGGPGLAGFLRRGLLGPLGLGGPSLPLDAGDTDTVPWWIRQAVHTRDGHCQWPTGCAEPAAGCHQHHLTPRHQHGHSSTANLGDFCDTHHLFVVHKLGWKVRQVGDGTWEATAPDGRIFKTRGRPPPPRPG